MDPQPHATDPEDSGAGTALDATRQGVTDRLDDPYLTEHDRWVLRQFASFLGGITPGPDPRARRAPPVSPLRDRVGWTRVWPSAPETAR